MSFGTRPFPERPFHDNIRRITLPEEGKPMRVFLIIVVLALSLAFTNAFA